MMKIVMIINNHNNIMFFVINYQNKNVKEFYFNKMVNIAIGMIINVNHKSLHNVKMLII